jgi:hypothetical protein
LLAINKQGAARVILIISKSKIISLKSLLTNFFYAAVSFATFGHSSADVRRVGGSTVDFLALGVGKHKNVNLLQNLHLFATGLSWKFCI